MNAYKHAVLGHLERLLKPHAPVDRMLDFGSGDGWYSQQLIAHGLVRYAVPVDVLLRRKTAIAPVLYDGEQLPFEAARFDLVLAVDVLHHCPSPTKALEEALRCCGDLFLLKDHTYTSSAGWWALALLDEVGNRRFGVPSLYRYQRDWEWTQTIEGQGFHCEQLCHPARCEPRPPLSWFVNRLQFLGLWRRSRSTAASAPERRARSLAEGALEREAHESRALPETHDGTSRGRLAAS